MIAKFNFYDIYGYFLPGLVLVSFLWLPFGVVSGQWPKGELVGALIAIPLAYVAGHLLQAFAIGAAPSSAANGLHPSDVVLESSDATFSLEFKTKLKGKVMKMFELDIGDSAGGTRQRGDALSLRRRDALFLCRSTLIESKAALYGEQFEGMYALMRGLALALLLGAFHLAGWCIAFVTLAPGWVAPSIFAACALAALVIEFCQAEPPKSPGRKRAVISVLLVALALLSWGYALARGRTIDLETRYFFAGAVLLAGLLSRKCYSAYRSFTWEFAKSVYRDFVTYEKPRGDKKDEPNDGGGDSD